MTRLSLFLVRGAYLVMAASLLAAALVCVADLPPQPMSAPRLRVAAPEYEPATSFLASFGPGYERDLLTEFRKKFPCDISWVTAPDRRAALDMLRSGRVDLVVGFPGLPPGEMIIAAGPAYYHASAVQATLPSLDVPTPPVSRDNLPPEDGTSPVTQRLLAGQRVLDARSWALWEPFIPASEVGRVPLAEPPEDAAPLRESHHWFWRKTNPPLHAALETFWSQRTSPADTLLDSLEERYFGYLPPTMDPCQVLDFLSIVRRRLPRYRQMITRALDGADVDPLLFTAVVIQESRMNEGTVSHTGVRGIMQLTQETAAFLGVDRMDPSQALRGGARYLRMLWEQLESLELDPWDRWFFTLAAFNQGPRRLEGAMALSRLRGGTGRTWKELKEIFPLLARTEYAAQVGQGVCRGQEAVVFVERVRWYYHILRGLVALDRPEAQHLAPLLRAPLF